MAIVFYYGSGSPFSWPVWLMLEHKQLSYDLKLMSLLGGDLKTPEYLAINPRGKVPVIIDNGYSLWESSAIMEYLEDQYPDRPLLPSDPKDRATARRIAAEAHTYLYPPLRRLMEQTLFRPDGNEEQSIIQTALTDLQQELAYFEVALQNEFFSSMLSIADFTIYPLLALVDRIQQKQPQHKVGTLMGAKLTAFMHQIEQLPYFTKTIPPHWKG
jgi:glutathione S-transferase